MSSPTPPPGAPSIPSPTAPTANSANLVGIPPDATSEATAITAQPLGGKMTTTTTTASTPHANPKVAELQIMFPSIDPDVIEVILESCGGSSDRTIETLLQMTDPEFKPETVAVRSEEEVGVPWCLCSSPLFPDLHRRERDLHRFIWTCIGETRHELPSFFDQSSLPAARIVWRGTER